MAAPDPQPSCVQELSLLEYSMLQHTPSVVAAACLSLALARFAPPAASTRLQPNTPAAQVRVQLPESHVCCYCCPAECGSCLSGWQPYGLLLSCRLPKSSPTAHQLSDHSRHKCS